MLTLLLHPLAFRAAGIRPRTAPAAGAISMAEPKCTVIFLRHGQSVWNEANLFTGWADVELTTLGKNEAAMGATEMWRAGLSVDVAYTSRLKRAQQVAARLPCRSAVVQIGSPPHQRRSLVRRPSTSCCGSPGRRTRRRTSAGG